MNRFMSLANSVVLVAVLAAVLLLPLAACTPKSPEEQVAEARASYTIELNSWQPVKQEEPVPEEGAAEGEEALAEPAPDETGEETGEVVVDAGPETRDVLFDLVIYFKGRKSLPGITVDITHAGAGEEEKGTYRQYIETAGIVNGETRQADFVIEGLPVEEGDVFAVEVVAGVPADLGEYREFSETDS